MSESDPPNEADRIWRQLEDRLRLVQPGPVYFPSVDELDGYKAHLKYPHLFESSLKLKAAYGQLLFMPPKSADDHELLQILLDSLREVNFSDSNGACASEEPNLVGKLTESLQFISEAIKRRQLSTKLVLEWGAFCQASAVLFVLEALQGSAESAFEKGVKGALTNDTTTQRYWYAHWMNHHGYPARFTDGTYIQNELAELCAEIVGGSVSPIAFEVNWFDAMIKPDPDTPNVKTLLRTYTDVSRAEIKRMIANQRIPVEKLPPLDRKNFPKVRPHP